MTEDLRRTLGAFLAADNPDGYEANVADGLFAIAKSIARVADALNALGNGNAATSMGAIEAFGLHIGEKLDSLTEAIRSFRVEE